uniref:Uncharacterized protein n=1 Tax=Arundo donax TaxID=35708 RepID=A0A0A9CPX8_ARUDO
MDVVTGALSSLLPKLDDLLVGEYTLQRGVKGEIRFLQTELESMQAALKEISMAPADQLHNNDRIWARDVRELSYDIEDSIDTFMVRGQGSEPAESHGFKKFIERCCDLLSRFHIRREIAVEIRDIKRRVIEVCERRDRYKIDSVRAKHVTATIDPRLLGRYTKATEFVGIDEARDEVIKILMEDNEMSKQQYKIVSIVGFGGLGKTTLANVVYEKLRAQFVCSAFVSVSQTPDMEKLFKGMLHQLDKNKYASIKGEAWDEEQLIHELRELLEEKRYFIVIDDIWDISVWKNIRCALPDNNIGYKIITTTRILSVAEKTGGSYKLKPLSLQNSRKLFYGRIFGSENNEDKDKCPNEQLAEVSDKILNKCAGVPLAIITIASLISSKGRNKIEWYEVYNPVGTGMEDNLDLDNMRKILSLSYYDMPSHLRTCLLYLSVFPEDYDIRKDHLIWMWISEGFIQSEKQRKSLFELGESYFNELINRSMIQPIYKYNIGTINYCRVHDMVLDLIRSLSSEENFVTILDDMYRTSQSNTVRRLSIQNGKEDHVTTRDTKEQGTSKVSCCLSICY